MRRRSARSRSPLILGMGEHPLRDGEKLVVGMAQADQLDAERQALVACAQRQRDARRTGKRPDRVEARIAGELLSLRRLAWRARADQHVEAVEQRIDMRLERHRLALRGDVALEGDAVALLQD